MTRRLPLPARRTFASIDRTTGSRIGPLAPFPHLQRRGDLCPAQAKIVPRLQNKLHAVNLAEFQVEDREPRRHARGGRAKGDYRAIFVHFRKHPTALFGAGPGGWGGTAKAIKSN